MNSDVLRSSNLETVAGARETGVCPILTNPEEWNRDQFAYEQIRGLVRQVFFSNVAQPVRQILFTSAEGQTDVALLCRQVGEALAREVKGNVAVLGRELSTLKETRQEEIQPENIRSRAGEPGSLPLRNVAKRIKGNLWLLTEIPGPANQSPPSAALYARLCELRAEFEYSIIEGPPLGLSSEAAALGQLTDGIVLVLTAHKTRRVAAKKVKEALEAARVRILGTVLSERTFPIPNALYRRL
jgi:Mrp family chromosome partitioning ATPase